MAIPTMIDTRELKTAIAMLRDIRVRVEPRMGQRTDQDLQDAIEMLETFERKLVSP